MHLFLIEPQPYPFLLYVGPDQILPLTSVLAAITGFLLLLWKQIQGWARRLAQLFTKRKAGTTADPDGK